jgi:hypothetical protein
VTGPPLVAGPHAPATATPPRALGSVRRTTSIDTVRPDGPDGELVVDARGRDLRTGPDGVDQVEVLGEVALALRLEPATHALVDIRADRAGADGLPDFRPLLGASVGSGFRRLLDQALPGERDRGSLLYLLLDDLVGAVLVSGYSLLHADALPRRDGLVDAMAARLGDQCAGLQGTTFDDLRLRIRRELVGTASCTHLNDTLRSLADLGALLSGPGRP